MNIFQELTRDFNRGEPRAILAGGQAVVLHRLAMMSKDGDWVLRETPEVLQHILQVLLEREARYRFGAPLDTRWLAFGWSSHLEFQAGKIRVRTDFFTRPPRLDFQRIQKLWIGPSDAEVRWMDLADLAESKKTNREKDYPIIGELARRMSDPADRILYSRSARDLIALQAKHAELFQSLVGRRPALQAAAQGLSGLETALDAERRTLMHANEERLAKFTLAAAAWARAWPEVEREAAGKPLLQAHDIIQRRAEALLPFDPGIKDSS